MKSIRSCWLTVICVGFALFCGAPEAAAQAAYNEADVDVKPVLKKAVRVKFPSSLKKKGVNGDIVLRFVVNTEGKVEDIEVLKFADADMVEPAYAAYEKAKYEPGQKEGQPVKTKITVNVPYPPPE